MTASQSLLVVDDEDIVCQSCTRIFERQGFRVETTTSPREGLRLATARDYRAVLLDVVMPELGGLEFLEQLRALRPDVPVIIMTGFSSISNATEALRREAADYVPKPFTPQEISDAVARVLAETDGRAAAAAGRAPAPAEALRLEARPAGVWRAAATDHLFHGEAWLQVGRDGTACVGALLPRDVARDTVAVKLARTGDVLVRGLPLAELTLAGGRRHVVPAPLAGEVLEVNPAALAAARQGGDEPGLEGWLALVQPRHLAADLLAGETRSVVLACADSDRALRMRRRLAELGCAVEIAPTFDLALRILGRLRRRVLLLDDASLGDAGPELARQAVAARPEVRVVVLAGDRTGREVAYRTGKLFYYALDPFADDEIVDILAAAFSAPARPLPARAATSALPASVRSIGVTNRAGEPATLLAAGGVIHENAGLGYLVISRLLGGSYPVQVTLGTAPLTERDVASATGRSGRVLVLLPQDTGRLPGTLTPRPVRVADGAQLTTLVVQPAPTGAALAFDVATLEAMATAIVDLMTGAPPA